MAGCIRASKEVQYARSTKLPEELNGFMRLAQDKVTVNIIGTPDIAIFNGWDKTRSDKPEERNLSAYIVMHEQDVGQFVKNTRKLQAIQNDPEIAALIQAKGLNKE